MSDFSKFFATDCQLMKSGINVFFDLVIETRGDPCTTGCAFFKNGNCRDYKLIKSFEKDCAHTINKPKETVREKAKRLGISISQARKEGR